MNDKSAQPARNVRRLPPNLLDLARRMRHEPSTAERKLWSLLRNRQLFNLKFRRQVPFGTYIADFYCADSKLIVELDGDSHDGREVYDQTRTEWLEGRELRVVRFTNLDISSDVESVLVEVAKACGVDL